MRYVLWMDCDAVKVSKRLPEGTTAPEASKALKRAAQCGTGCWQCGGIHYKVALSFESPEDCQV